MGAACVGCYMLQPNEQLRVNSCTDRSVINGPGFKTVGFGKTTTRNTGQLLGPTQYAVFENTLTAELIQVKGPQLYFPGPYDVLRHVKNAVVLKQNEYVKLQHSETGAIRVVRGECAVYPAPLETYLKPKSRAQPQSADGFVWKAFTIDLETAALVRDSETGVLRLETTPGLFFCDLYEEIVDKRPLIRLLDHETVIIKDNDGRYTFVDGSNDPGAVVAMPVDAETPSLPGKLPGAVAERAVGESKASAQDTEDGCGRSFFLPPYHEMVRMMWSTGDEKKTVSLAMDRIDRRPMFMNYKFLCRTSDNVELSLKVTFFWQIVDVPLMLKYTNDPPGDVCHHARSAVIQNVTKVTLQEFMKNFNTIVDRAILGRGDTFYEERGVKIHTVEVLQFHCKDAAIERVLQAIIQESTNRMNRLQQQESENEVRVHRLRGEIDEERLRGDLLEIRHSHHRSEALMEGEAEADRCKAFITGMNGVVSKEEAVQMFNTLRKVDIMSRLAKGKAHMYFTPSQCDLSVETHVEPGAGTGAGAGAGAAGAGSGVGVRAGGRA